MAAPAYEDVIRKDAADELAAEMVRCMQQALTAHGSDPLAVALLAASVETMVREIERVISPAFRKVLVHRLSIETAP